MTLHLGCLCPVRRGRSTRQDSIRQGARLSPWLSEIVVTGGLSVIAARREDPALLRRHAAEWGGRPSRRILPISSEKRARTRCVASEGGPSVRSPFT
jgi:hypothetical protein